MPTRRPFQRVLSVLTATAIYAVAFVTLAPFMGASVAALSAFVAIFAGYVLGRRRGIAWAGALVVLNLALEWATEPGRGLHLIDAFYGVVIIALAAAAGHMRRARERLVASMCAARSATEAALRAERQYHELIDNVPDMIFVHRDGIILYANEASARTVAAASAQALIGSRVLDLIPKEQHDLVRERIRQALDGKLLDPIRLRIGLKGHAAWAETRSIRTDWGGKPAVLTLGRDVTEAVAQDAKLRSNERLLLQAQEVAHIGSWVLREGETVIACSTNMRALVGLSPGESLTVSVARGLVHPDDLGGIGPLLRKARTDGQSAFSTFRIVRPDGATRWLRFYVQADVSPEGKRSMHGLAQDITDQHQVDVALSRSERLSALGTLVAGVAHEINNPLSYMRGNLELSAFDLDDIGADVEKRAAALERLRVSHATVLRGIERIASITQSLKQLSRTADAPMAIIDPNEVLREIATIAQARSAKGAVIELSAGATSHVHASSTQLAQVLLNLALNALDALKEREDPRIRLGSRTSNGDTFLEVEDNGAGIPRQVQAQIFVPFFTTKAQGTGLGLALSHRIIEEHGGELTFTSEPGKTIFRVRLPTASGVGPAPPAAAAAAPATLFRP